jgi:CHAT domain-containing protein
MGAFSDLCAATESEGAILHVTCHGVPPRSEPGDAALLLADADLEAAAIANDGIPFTEVVLTACSTGYRPTTEAQGIRLSGDDVLGLPGAFLEAGASTMLVSIPLAQAEAAHRMALGYHGARLDSLPPLAAFRRAQLALLSDPSVRARNACGFVLYGCH